MNATFYKLPMKFYLIIALFLVTCFSFSQNNEIVKTEDGRRVLLKADYTWEYIDLEKPKKSTNCNLAEDFTEPPLNNKIQSQLKRGRATIIHVKEKVAKDYNCAVEDVILLSFSEQKAKGIYNFCANGTRVTYKRNGYTIIENGKFF